MVETSGLAYLTSSIILLEFAGSLRLLQHTLDNTPIMPPLNQQTRDSFSYFGLGCQMCCNFLGFHVFFCWKPICFPLSILAKKPLHCQCNSAPTGRISFERTCDKKQRLGRGGDEGVNQKSTFLPDITGVK